MNQTQSNIAQLGSVMEMSAGNTLISGGVGTGKSTILAAIANKLIADNPDWTLLACGGSSLAEWLQPALDKRKENQFFNAYRFETDVILTEDVPDDEAAVGNINKAAFYTILAAIEKHNDHEPSSPKLFVLDEVLNVFNNEYRIDKLRRALIKQKTTGDAKLRLLMAMQQPFATARLFGNYADFDFKRVLFLHNHEEHQIQSLSFSSKMISQGIAIPVELLETFRVARELPPISFQPGNPASAYLC
jgi:hypothetical protein